MVGAGVDATKICPPHVGIETPTKPSGLVSVAFVPRMWGLKRHQMKKNDSKEICPQHVGIEICGAT